MFKKLQILFLILFLSTTFVFSQTLKVTAIDATETKLYDFAAKSYLGKNLELSVYDNSATVILPVSDKLILRATSNNLYSYVEKDSDKESMTFFLTINKTVGVVTSINLKLVIQEKVGQHRSANYVLTAKRF